MLFSCWYIGLGDWRFIVQFIRECSMIEMYDLFRSQLSPVVVSHFAMKTV